MKIGEVGKDKMEKDRLVITVGPIVIPIIKEGKDDWQMGLEKELAIGPLLLSIGKLFIYVNAYRQT